METDGISEVTDDVYESLLGKHPQGETPVWTEVKNMSRVVINSEIVSKQLRSFPAHSAAGPFGERIEHSTAINIFYNQTITKIKRMFAARTRIQEISDKFVGYERVPSH